MEVVTSSVTSDLISRAISFLIDKCSNRASLVEKSERLQHLLLRVHTVVEEADGRFITNSGMLMQLKMLAQGMYRGYYVLDNFKNSAQDEVSGSHALSFASSVKRFRTINGTTRSTAVDLQGALQSLETMVDNMKEFVILLGGCERMHRNPYDTYLYIDNFMFSRHVEKQHVINTLLQNNVNQSAPAVLPIIGSHKVGKKTLVEHVCNNEKIRSHFSSVLHINGECIGRMDHKNFPLERTLVVVEFILDVEDKDWMKFYSSMSHMGRGSKVIIVSRHVKHARFGTVGPIHLTLLPQEEYRYLFKVLAFGSTNPEEHPRLASVGNELATLMRGSFIIANIIADVLRKNLNTHFWFDILKRYKGTLENNLLLFGDHTICIDEKERPVDITKLILSPAPVRLLPRQEGGGAVSRSKLPKVTFGELIVGSASPPQEKFELVTWESRLPPYSKLVQTCVGEKPQNVTSLCKKRRGVDK